MMTEGREVDPDQIAHHVVHPVLHQDYTTDFRSRRATDIAPTLTSPILVGIASSMRLPERLTMPEGPEIPKVQEGLQGGGRSSCSASYTRPFTHRRAYGDRGREAVGGPANRSQCHHPD